VGKDVVTGRAVAQPAAAKARVVVFLSAHCPCSAAHEPTLALLHQRFASKGVAFVAVNSNANETEGESKSHFSKAKLPFPVIHDPQSRWANELGALKTPHAFVLDEKGDVVFSGGVDDSRDSRPDSVPYLAKALDSVVEGRKPDPSSVRAIGCVISRP
jgi:peroxiredoxin